jgi:hypothetical protein
LITLSVHIVVHKLREPNPLAPLFYEKTTHTCHWHEKSHKKQIVILALIDGGEYEKYHEMDNAEIEQDRHSIHCVIEHV